jgi:predicted DNA-binding mobile mystery protein A
VNLYCLLTVNILNFTVYEQYNEGMATKQTHLLAATQIDRKLAPLRAIAASLRPSSAGGWIRALRQGLGLSAAALGSRMHLAQQSVNQLEKNERAGAITLASLRRAAEALDAELFYAIIPRKPLRQTIAERAKDLARKRVAPVAHSMQLEAQGLADNELQERIDELALELERNPRELWR